MRVASDIGGTFTDLVYLDEATGEMDVNKASTTPRDFAEGVIETLKRAELPVSNTTFFVHGSTIIINALTERKGAKTGLITTKGFRDVLEITRANRPDLYNMYYTKPKPFVPRQFRLEARERVNYKGEDLEPLNEGDVKNAVKTFKREHIPTPIRLMRGNVAKSSVNWFRISPSHYHVRSHRNGESTSGQTRRFSTVMCLRSRRPISITLRSDCLIWGWVRSIT
jgi:hypothetical protein